MFGSRKISSKLAWLCLTYIVYKYCTISEDDKKKVNVVETVHPNEMRLMMWKMGLNTFQNWMKVPPSSRLKTRSVEFENSQYFDMKTCNLLLEDGDHNLSSTDLQECESLKNVYKANITIINGFVAGLATLKLYDNRICHLVYKEGVMHGMQRFFVNCVHAKHRGEKCLQLVGE